MIENVKEEVTYMRIGKKFICNNPNCNYIVTSEERSDFTVEDFKFCPKCGLTEKFDKKETEIATLKIMAFKALNKGCNNSKNLKEYEKGVYALLEELENFSKLCEDGEKGEENV